MSPGNLTRRLHRVNGLSRLYYNTGWAQPVYFLHSVRLWSDFGLTCRRKLGYNQGIRDLPAPRVPSGKGGSFREGSHVRAAERSVPDAKRWLILFCCAVLALPAACRLGRVRPEGGALSPSPAALAATTTPVSSPATPTPPRRRPPPSRRPSPAATGASTPADTPSPSPIPPSPTALPTPTPLPCPPMLRPPPRRRPWPARCASGCTAATTPDFTNSIPTHPRRRHRDVKNDEHHLSLRSLPRPG